MKKISKGEMPELWLGTCEVCQAKFEAEAHEADGVTRNFRADTIQWWKACPECGAGSGILNGGVGGIRFVPSSRFHVSLITKGAKP